MSQNLSSAAVVIGALRVMATEEAKKCRQPTDPNCFTLRNLAIVPMLSHKWQNFGPFEG